MESLESGSVFGRWTVLSVGEPYSSPRGRSQSVSICMCQCGTTKAVLNATLKGGCSKSCGCLRAELQKKMHTTHGYTIGRRPTPEYEAWSSINKRTTNPKHKQYPRYGGRGITICDRWRHSFENFLADMGPRPSSGHSIDRFPDNNGGYCKENCRWATRTEQQNNRECNHLLTFYGKTMSLSEWARISQVESTTIYQRLKAGWPEKKAVWQPTQKRKQKYKQRQPVNQESLGKTETAI